MILTCTDQGTSQRWDVRKHDGDSTEEVFVRGNQLGTKYTWNSFTFTLISTDFNSFESTLSTVVTNAVNNTEVVCTGLSSSDTTIIRIAGKLTQAMITCMILYLQMSPLPLKASA